MVTAPVVVAVPLKGPWLVAPVGMELLWGAAAAVPDVGASVGDAGMIESCPKLLGTTVIGVGDPDANGAAALV